MTPTSRFFISLFVGCASAFGTPTVQAQTTPAAQLVERLAQTAAKRQFLFGHHDDTVYGHTWCGDEGRSDVKEVCGRYPALMNWDLGLIEWQRTEQLDGVNFNRMRREIVAQDARGGLNAFSWHLRNPLTRGDSWDVQGIDRMKPETCPVAKAVDPACTLNDTLRTWIGRVADFIGSLRRADGSRIAVVFRPWHEHSGSWFWWGRNHCSPAEYKALWRLTREVFDARGIDNVVWAYSPDVVDSYADYIERYPGDKYVDIMGADVYHRDGEAGVPAFYHNLNRSLRAAQLAATHHRKLLAFSETGSETLPMAHWWTKVLLPALKPYNVAYVCVWRNAHDKPEHFYAPYPGQASAADFCKFASSPRVVMAGK